MQKMHIEKTKAIIKGNELNNMKRSNYKDKEILHSQLNEYKRKLFNYQHNLNELNIIIKEEIEIVRIFINSKVQHMKKELESKVKKFNNLELEYEILLAGLANCNEGYVSGMYKLSIVKMTTIC